MNHSIIEQIQSENPSYDPLTQALALSNVDKDTWKAACNRVYFDGMFGPISDEDWQERDGREPSNVNEAIKLIAQILDKVDDYGEYYDDFYVDANEIRKDLVPWYREIYGVGYPSV